MTSPHDKFAKNYEEQIVRYDCWLAEVVFGFCYANIKRGESLLDVGIGTGLSSHLFHLAGLRIFGIDGSAEMLSICKSKEIVEELTQQDILELPWPYQNSSIEHVISCGVFHFIRELDPILAEIQRVQKQNGLLTFSVMKSDEKQGEQRNFEQRIIDGIPVFSHSAKYIQSLLNDFHYEKKKEIVCLVGDTPFRVICARKSRA
jgi:predicted TPR repeat methyltransferase